MHARYARSSSSPPWSRCWPSLLCGGRDPSTGSAAPSGSAGGAAFPATVTHTFDTTTAPAAPQRAVSLGCTDQDAILAPGVVPVAIREFTGNRPPATWPWAQPGLARRTPTVPPVGDVSTESVAAPGRT